MPIQRSHFPIYNFVALGKVAIGIDRVEGEIHRKSCMISCSLHQAALESLRGQRSERKSDRLLEGIFHYLNQTCCRQRLLSVWNQ